MHFLYVMFYVFAWAYYWKLQNTQSCRQRFTHTHRGHKCHSNIGCSVITLNWKLIFVYWWSMIVQLNLLQAKKIGHISFLKQTGSYYSLLLHSLWAMHSVIGSRTASEYNATTIMFNNWYSVPVYYWSLWRNNSSFFLVGYKTFLPKTFFIVHVIIYNL